MCKRLPVLGSVLSSATTISYSPRSPSVPQAQSTSRLSTMYIQAVLITRTPAAYMYCVVVATTVFRPGQQVSGNMAHGSWGASRKCGTLEERGWG
jgi:hypothetical protein